MSVSGAVDTRVALCGLSTPAPISASTCMISRPSCQGGAGPQNFISAGWGSVAFTEACLTTRGSVSGKSSTRKQVCGNGVLQIYGVTIPAWVWRQEWSACSALLRLESGGWGLGGYRLGATGREAVGAGGFLVWVGQWLQAYLLVRVPQAPA